MKIEDRAGESKLAQSAIVYISAYAIAKRKRNGLLFSRGKTNTPPVRIAVAAFFQILLPYLKYIFTPRNPSLSRKDTPMPNLSQVIKAEIVRIAHKEIKTSVNPLRSSNFVLRRHVASLKKQVAALESDNKRFLALQNNLQEKKAETQIAEVKDNNLRVTSKSVKALRTKLGLSQEGFASLLGISGQSVYAMEHKSGRLRLRIPTMTKLIGLRGIGKREAAKRLEEIELNDKKQKSKGRKK